MKVDGSIRESFSHFTRQIVNDAGLEGASQVTVGFEPSYQQVTFHWLRIHRDGQWLDRLSVPQMKVIQREPELESQVYDGRLSAITFIEDLRVGDVLDYAYTIRGANPVFGPAFFESFALDWSVSIERASFRLLWPPARHLNVRNQGTRIEPRSRPLGGYTEMVWESADTRAVTNESGVPAWHDPWGWVQLSEYSDWGEVANWGWRLFDSVRAPLTPQLRQKVEEWKARSADPDERALLATRFVQDEVRYVGLEMGEGSHRPTRPDIVFRRRFGDCKDKALLLATLLTELGFDAKPALINTDNGPLLPKWLPTPLAFNHAVVAVNRGTTRLWIDATIAGQGGHFGEIHFPSYSHGLILDQGTKDLTPILVSPPAEPTLDVTNTYTSQSYDAPASLVVESRYLHVDADGMRSQVASTSLGELGKSFTKFYEPTYPGIQATSPPEVRDDRDANVITIVEKYTIPSFWEKPRSAGRRPKVDVYPLALLGVVPKPVPADRTKPLALDFPRKAREITHVTLPEDWATEPDTETIGDDSMRLGFRYSGTPRRVTVTYDYETLRDGVPAEQLAAHRDVRQRIINRLGAVVGGGSAVRGGGLNWSAVILLAALSPIALAASVWILRKRSTNSRSPLDPALAGIAGGLHVVGLLLTLAVVRYAWALYDTRFVWSLDEWLVRTNPDQDSYHPWWAPYLFVNLLGNSLSLCLAVVLILLFLTKRRTFPRVLAWFLVFQGTFFLISALLARFLPEVTGTAFDFLLAVSWAIGPLAAFLPYLFISDRARSTFVR